MRVTLAGMSSFYYRDENAPRPNRPRRTGVAALIEHDGLLLLERRADAPVWSLVSGGVDDDETLEEALRREVREETGLEVASYSFFGTFSDPSRVACYPDGNTVQLITLVYRVEAEDATVLSVSPESRELRFFGKDDLPPDDLIAVARPIMERYLSGDVSPFLD
jgi:8-oxo-dGTP pyrophosphatase MutT (NUDIX family)